MHTAKDLFMLARGQRSFIHDTVSALDNDYAVPDFDKRLEAYVQTRIALALRYGETTI